MPINNMNQFIIRIVSLIAVVFGLVTIKEGGAVLYGIEEARMAAGNYVPFVLWFNFSAGFIYIFTGVSLWLRRRWAVWLAFGIATATLIFFVLFGAHIYGGGAYEYRTVAAMSFRSIMWLIIGVLAWRLIIIERKTD